MYAWIWRRFPGAWHVKTVTALGVVAVVAALFWYVVFPWVEPKIQFDHGVVQNPAPSASATPG